MTAATPVVPPLAGTGGSSLPVDAAAVCDPRVARSRARLLDAATALLVEGGPVAVTVDAVVERSGVAKSTLYRHWPSRTDLLVDVMRTNMPVTEAPDLSSGFEPALRAMVRDLAVALSGPRWSHILPALLALAHHRPELAELLAVDRSARLGVLDELLDLGVAEGWFSTAPDRARAAQLLAGPLVFAVLTGDTADLPSLADDVVDTYLAAHRPRDAQRRAGASGAPTDRRTAQVSRGSRRRGR
jgi:AcrR family transcriptional regulator